MKAAAGCLSDGGFTGLCPILRFGPNLCSVGNSRIQKQTYNSLAVASSG